MVETRIGPDPTAGGFHQLLHLLGERVTQTVPADGLSGRGNSPALRRSTQYFTVFGEQPASSAAARNVFVKSNATGSVDVGEEAINLRITVGLGESAFGLLSGTADDDRRRLLPTREDEPPQTTA